MTRTRSQDNRLANNKSSEKPTQSCSNIKADSNAYKIQKTGEIVCKSFWTSIKSTDVDKQQSVAETKSCKVFLKDVLKVTALKEQKLHQAEEKEQQKKLASAVTEKPPAVESKSRKAATEAENETGRQAQKRPARSSKNDSIDVKELPTKRLRSSAKQVTADPKEAVSEIASQKFKPPEQEDAALNSRQSYTPDSTATSNRTLTRHKRTTGASLSDADVDSRRDRKKLKAILAGNTAIKNMEINGESSNEEAPPRRKRLRFTSASPITIDLTKSDKGEESDNKHAAARKGKVRTRRLRRSSLASKPARKAKSSESDNKESADEEAKLYVCKECGANYENKLVGLTHQLTHYKQPKLALEKRVIDNVEKEAVHASEAVDDQCEDQTETIAIRVDDDEEETAGDVSNLDGSDRLEVSAEAEEKASSAEKEGKEMKETMEEEKVKETIEAEEVKEIIEAEEVNETTEAEEVNETIEAEEEKETTNEKEAIEAKDTQETMDTKEVDTKETKDAKETKDTKEDTADVELVVKESTDDEPDQAEEPEEEKESESTEIVATPSPSRGRKRGSRKSGARWGRARKSSTRRRSRSRSNMSDKSDIENVSQAKVEESTSMEQTKDVSRTQIQDISEEVKKEEQTEEGEEGSSSKAVEEPEEDKKVEKVEETPKESKDKEKEEEAVCTEQDSEPVDKESMNGLKSSADVDEAVALVDEETPEPKEDEHNGVEEKGAQSEIETRLEDASGKAEDTEKAKSPKRAKSIDSCEENKKNEEEQSVQANGDAPVTSEAPLEGADVLKDSELPGEKDAEKAEEDALESKTPKPEKPTSESANVAAEVLQEVLDLASAEVQKRQDVIDADTNNDSVDTETLENISREIQNSVDMPSLKIDSANTGNDSE